MVQEICFGSEFSYLTLSSICQYQFVLANLLPNKVLFLVASANVGGIMKSSCIGCLNCASTADSSKGGSALDLAKDHLSNHAQ